MGKYLTIEDFNIPKTAVEENILTSFTSEDEFMGVAVDLLKEIGQITSLIAGIFRVDNVNLPRKWTRNEAILGGMFVRISKLQRGILGTTCEKKMEITHILFRCATETIVNLMYLLHMNSEDVFDEYVKYSLRVEKKLLIEIQSNIEERGHELPIEKRIIKSIKKSFVKSEMSLDEIDENKTNPWSKSLYQKAKEIGFQSGYLPFFSLPSHHIHGNWQDLLQYHISCESDGFLPNLDWGYPRPQLLLALSKLSAMICSSFLFEIVPECKDRNLVNDRIGDCERRIELADRLHENYLVRRNSC